MPRNIITIIEDGPLKVEGEAMVYNTVGELVTDETPLLLCRCGASKNKPLCDGQHKAIGFKDACKVDNSRDEELEAHTPLVISSRPNAMLVVRGPMIIVGPDGRSKARRNRAALCRCGMSRNKPFCDVTHKKQNFVDDALNTEQNTPAEQEQKTGGDDTA